MGSLPRIRTILPIFCAGLAARAALGATPPDFHSGRVSFTVQAADETLDYETLAVSVMPGESLRIIIPFAGPDSTFSIATEGAPRPIRIADTRSWSWLAPDEPGSREITVIRDATGEAMHIRVFILTPADEIGADGALHGYMIGSYPERVFRGLEAYRPPRGFIEVNRDNRRLAVSPHFRLEQFLCKQAGDYPKYARVEPRLVRALETLLEKLNDLGQRADTLFVMSGFRTPAYNAALGDTEFSRHQWGDAADVYPDQNGDGLIDDLNGDGKSDDGDADALYALVDSLSRQHAFQPFTGGLGRYGSSRSHPPFVHIDTRGYRARWRD